uniref:Vitellogenin n=1 Tax=Romanomermis culicivorax TaxID=13658 RepID=A0A915J6C3_ROMCU
QIEEIEAEQLVWQPQPGLHQPPLWQIGVADLAEQIFLIAQASISVSPNCQQWVTGTVFPLTSPSIPHLIVQPLPKNQVAIEFPMETVVVNITNSRCPLSFVNNTPNRIKLRPNQLLAIAKHTLESITNVEDFHVATVASGCDLTDDEPATLDKSLPHHEDKQKLEFALNKMTQKRHVSPAQKAKALGMMRQN